MARFADNFYFLALLITELLEYSTESEKLHLDEPIAQEIARQCHANVLKIGSN